MQKSNAQKSFCPICQKLISTTTNNSYIPFCSIRCKTIDLGNWLSDHYRIPVELDEETKEELDNNNLDNSKDN